MKHFPTLIKRPLIAVGAVVFKDNRVLLVRRGKPPAVDVWAIPGGKVLWGETLQNAAEREILEETGIVIKAGRPIYTFDFMEYHDNDRLRFHYVIVDLAAEYIAGELLAGDDAIDARWVSEQEIAQLNISTETLKLLRDRFRFGG